MHYIAIKCTKNGSPRGETRADCRSKKESEKWALKVFGYPLPI